MARIRSIKPEFFKHEELFEAELECRLPLRLAFASLWIVADREGRFKWRPRTLKTECLPYDDIDFSRVMDALAEKGFVVKYEVGGDVFGCIPNWTKHQVVNIREAKSVFPSPDGSHVTHVRAHVEADEHTHTPSGINVPGPLRQTVIARDGHKCGRCPATEDLTVDHIFPKSMGGTHAITNLRCLCRKCNSARPVAGQALVDDLAKDGFTFDDMQRMCMHVQAPVETCGEGKGREPDREGKGREDISSLRSDTPDKPPQTRKKLADRKFKHTLPDDWQPDQSDLDYFASIGLSKTQFDRSLEALRFWAKSNEIKKCDWHSTLKGFLRRDADKFGVQAPGASAATPTVSDDDWRRWMRRFDNGDGPWPNGLGPRPRVPGCRVPDHVMAEFLPAIIALEMERAPRSAPGLIGMGASP